MMAGNQLLKFENRPVRVIDKEGELWWVAKDVCEVLAIKDHNQAIHGNPARDGGGLDEDEKGAYNVTTPSGEQEMLCVNESGLYSLILKSKKPEAKRFKRWVTHDVLPSIRQKGIYVADESDLVLMRKFSTLENRLARLEEDRADAEVLARSLPEPLGVLPEMTNVQSINKAARAFSQLTGIRAGAVWPLVWTEIEYRFGVRMGARKKRAGWKGSTLSFAVHEGYADKVYDVIFDLMKRYTSRRAA